MKRTILILAMLAATFAAHATEPRTKTVTTGYAGACQGASLADEARIRRSPLFGTAISAARVVCSPALDSSQNGTHTFGVTLSNTSTVNVVVTCTAQISTVGPGAQINVTRSVMVSPKARGNLSWSSASVGEGRTFRGGQLGVTCTLPAGVALSNVWTQSVSN